MYVSGEPLSTRKKTQRADFEALTMYANIVRDVFAEDKTLADFYFL
jgi:hypothetical protein